MSIIDEILVMQRNTGGELVCRACRMLNVVRGGALSRRVAVRGLRSSSKCLLVVVTGDLVCLSIVDKCRGCVF